MDYKEIRPEELSGNVFNMIANDWMLITAEKDGAVNTMTASWGGLGFIWRKPVAYIFIRPQRHTFGFVEASDRLTLSFFGGECRDALRICGTKSGRDCDKIAEAGLTPISLSEGCTSFEEATVIMECSKLYAQDLTADSVIDPAIFNEYKAGDYHRMYVVSIDRLLVKS